MSYPVEIKLASAKGYFTPSQSNAYYSTKYARNGVICHWWGNGWGADRHDDLVNYMLTQAKQGIKSVNYVLSDKKITMLVNPDNVAWCSGPKANPITISVETQPTLGKEGYKKWGWLLNELEHRYKKKLDLTPHRKWAATTCPGTLDLNRIRAEAERWKSGYYDPTTNQVKVAPQPQPQQGADMPEKITVDTSRILTHGVLAKNGLAGRGTALAGANGGDNYTGKELTNKLVQELFLSKDGRQWRDSNDADSIGGINLRLNEADSAKSKLANMQAAAAESEATIAQLKDEVQKLSNNDQADQATIQKYVEQIAELTVKLEASNQVVQTGQIEAPAPSDSGQLQLPKASLLTRLVAFFLRKKV